MRVRFGSRMPSSLGTGETTYIYVDIVNDADHRTRFYIDFYYSTNDGRTWESFAHKEYSLDAGHTYNNLRTTVRFTMPDASEVMLGLLWRARRVDEEGVIREEVASGEDYHRIRNTRPPEEAPPEETPPEEVPPEEAPQECTKEEFRNSMINAYKDRAIYWIDSYTPILDVTSRVRNVKPYVFKAHLIIKGGDLNKIEVLGPYDSLPTKFPDGREINDYNIVQNWQYGEEWERQRCAKNNKYYWVKYPCILITIPPDLAALLSSTFGRFSRKLKAKMRISRQDRLVTRRGKVY